MDARPFTQNIVAIIWDFDRTLLPSYMQEPLFKRFDVDEATFWKEVNALPEYYRARGHGRVAGDTMYLSHILTYVRAGTFAGLNNAMLRKLGAELQFYPGIPDIFARLKTTIENNARFSKHDIKVEHYVVSTGLREMILGTPVGEHVEDVWACEFLEMTAPPGFLDGAADEVPEGRVLENVGYAIDNTTKTRAIFEINKGVNKHPEMDVNDRLAPENRRVPIENMIYIADGPSDVPVFSILNQYGGRTFAVYNPDKEKEFRQVVRLHEQGRIAGLGAADYRGDTHTTRWLTYWAEEIASRIADSRERALGESIGKPPHHIIDMAPAEAPPDQAGRAAQRSGSQARGDAPEEPDALPESEDAVKE
jgi:hypothetical protein